MFDEKNVRLDTQSTFGLPYNGNGILLSFRTALTLIVF